MSTRGTLNRRVGSADTEGKFTALVGSYGELGSEKSCSHTKRDASQDRDSVGIPRSSVAGATVVSFLVVPCLSKSHLKKKISCGFVFSCPFEFSVSALGATVTQPLGLLYSYLFGRLAPIVCIALVPIDDSLVGFAGCRFPLAPSGLATIVCRDSGETSGGLLSLTNKQVHQLTRRRIYEKSFV
jgi:hypothetical protein